MTTASSLKPEPKRRQCFVTTDKFIKGRGFVIGIVTEGIAGYAPTGANGTRPYIWSDDKKESENMCVGQNRKVYGLCPKEVLAIISSSMKA